MKRALYLLTVAVAVGSTRGSVLRGAEKPASQLSDEELGIKIGDLTPTKLQMYKKRMIELKGSLDTLMARQTRLNVEYETLLKTEGRDRDLKRQVRGMVARSVLKGMASLTDDRSAHVKEIVDEAVEQMKKDHNIALPHPDKPEERDAAPKKSATGSESKRRNSDTARLEKDSDEAASGPAGQDASGPSGQDASGPESSGSSGPSGNSESSGSSGPSEDISKGSQ